jgi:hypothetical protein
MILAFSTFGISSGWSMAAEMSPGVFQSSKSMENSGGLASGLSDVPYPTKSSFFASLSTFAGLLTLDFAD